MTAPVKDNDGRRPIEADVLAELMAEKPHNFGHRSGRYRGSRRACANRLIHLENRDIDQDRFDTRDDEADAAAIARKAT